MMKIRLIATDMDGTLLDENHQISKQNADALQEAMAQGVHVAFCTGRTNGDIHRLAREAGMQHYWAAGYNGMLIEDPQGVVRSHTHFTPDAALPLMEQLMRLPLVTCAFLPDRVARYWGDGGSAGFPDYEERGIRVEEGETALRRAVAEGPLKFLCIDRSQSVEHSALQLARQQIVGLPGVEVTSSWENNLELLPQGMDKGRAIQCIAEWLGVPREQTLALGDHHNDLPMLQWAGVGVAMGNAINEVRRAADDVTGTAQESGVAQAIRRIVLGERT